MRGRNRPSGGSSNNSSSSGNRGHHHNPLTRVYESNGQDVKIRGTAHTVAEKYLQLARDAAMAGDHVTAENHHQHAEHYLRVIATAQEQFRQQNPYYQPQQSAASTDTAESTFEDDGDDGQPTAGGQPQQNQPVQQAQPNYGSAQPQPPYPPREPPQPYSGYQQPYQGRQPQPQQPQQQPQPQQSQFSPVPQPQQPVNFDRNDGLPAFITGGQAPQPPQPNGQASHDPNAAGGYPLHRRRRRHRGPRPEVGSPELRSDPVTE